MQKTQETEAEENYACELCSDSREKHFSLYWARVTHERKERVPTQRSMPFNSLQDRKGAERNQKNRRLASACDYGGDVQVKNMEVEHLWNILLEGAPYMKKYEN